MEMSSGCALPTGAVLMIAILQQSWCLIPLIAGIRKGLTVKMSQAVIPVILSAVTVARPLLSGRDKSAKMTSADSR